MTNKLTGACVDEARGSATARHALPKGIDLSEAVAPNRRAKRALASMKRRAARKVRS